MSRVKRTWRMGEKPVNLALLSGYCSALSVEFECPGCGQHSWSDETNESLIYVCSCGARLCLRVAPMLEELEEEEENGE